jgi:prefoldin subunit 5
VKQKMLPTYMSRLLLSGTVESLTEQLANLEGASAELNNSLKDLQQEHGKVLQILPLVFQQEFQL